MQWVESIRKRFRAYAGLTLPSAIGVVCFFAAIGAAAGLALPKFEATALLQFPEAIKSAERRIDPLLPKLDLPTVELATFKRVAAMYSSFTQLKTYIDASGLQPSPATARLLSESQNPLFWEKVASPAFPFSRRDQKEYGDLKSAAGSALLGLELTVTAPTGEAAAGMIDVLSGYFTNAVLRERIRSWNLEGQADAIALQKILQADIVRAELEIRLLDQRATDMKSILARYPDAARMEARQVISVNPADGGERFLSPLAQLVGLESEVSRGKERIQRWEREFKQRKLLAQFFAESGAIIDSSVSVAHLIPALKALSAKAFASADQSLEWVREAMLRVDGALDGFAVAQTQFGVREGVRVAESPSRSPARLAVLLSIFGASLLAGLVLIRATLLGRDRSAGGA